MKPSSPTARAARAAPSPFVAARLLAACVLAGLSLACATTNPLLGKLAPPIVGTPLQGTFASLADARDKVVIVYMWASYCGPCKRSFAHYQALADTHADDVVLVAVGVDPREQRVEKLYAFLSTMHAKGAAVWDPDFPTRWGLPVVPEIILIDRNGRVRWVMTGIDPGGADVRWVAEKLNALLREERRP